MGALRLAGRRWRTGKAGLPARLPPISRGKRPGKRRGCRTKQRHHHDDSANHVFQRHSHRHPLRPFRPCPKTPRSELLTTTPRTRSTGVIIVHRLWFYANLRSPVEKRINPRKSSIRDTYRNIRQVVINCIRRRIARRTSTICVQIALRLNKTEQRKRATVTA